MVENRRKWRYKTENDARTRCARPPAPAPVSSSFRLSRSTSNHLGQLNNFLVTQRDGSTSILNSSTNSSTSNDGGNILPSLFIPTTNSPALTITTRHDNVRCLCRVSSLSLFWALRLVRLRLVGSRDTCMSIGCLGHMKI